ncbi:hypothetical protein K8Q96_01140 [Candidatus Nomurabacteria bacterium]|nr:hypothetical protein [Candidatus Nomurabacteria bacterium]
MFTLTILSACPQCDDHHMDTKKMREIVAQELKRVLSKIETVKESYQHVEYHD